MKGLTCMYGHAYDGLVDLDFHLGIIGLMVHRRRAIGIAAALAVTVSVGAVAQKKDEKKQDETQKKEVTAVVKLADDMAAGQAPPSNDLGLTWMREDFLKAQGNKEYIPFIVTIDPSKVSGWT